MQFESTFNGQLSIVADPAETYDHDEVIDAASDRIMEALLACDWIIDPIVSGSLVHGDIHVTLTVNAPDPEQALALMDSSVRAAMQAAEVHTPDWPTVHPTFRFESLREATDDKLIDGDDLIDA